MNLERGIFVKVERGVGHLQELERASYEYLTGIGDVSVVPNDDGQSYTVQLALPDPPQELSAMFGDVLHNFRSSLDYLARLLVVSSGKTPLDGRGGTMFPISTAKPVEALDLKPRLHPRLRARLNDIQPFNAEVPDRHPLALLNRLENIDKHRFLNLGAASLSAELGFVPLDGQVGPETRRYPVRLRTGQPDIVQVETEDFHLEPKASGMRSGTVVLAEGDGAWTDGIWLIGYQIAKHLTELFPPYLQLAREVYAEVHPESSSTM